MGRTQREEKNENTPPCEGIRGTVDEEKGSIKAFFRGVRGEANQIVRSCRRSLFSPVKQEKPVGKRSKGKGGAKKSQE